MTKKLLASITITLATALTSSAALADQPTAAPQVPLTMQRHVALPAPAAPQPILVADRRGGGGSMDVLDAQRATGRSGTMTLSARRTGRGADLKLISSDPRLAFGRVVVTYAGGQRLVLRGGGSAMDLPDGRIASIHVSYFNRGARGATIQLVARADRRNDRDDRDGGRRGNR